MSVMPIATFESGAWRSSQIERASPAIEARAATLATIETITVRFRHGDPAREKLQRRTVSDQVMLAIATSANLIRDTGFEVYAAGIQQVTTVPPPSRPRRVSRPPCASTISLQIARPSPVPDGFVE